MDYRSVTAARDGRIAATPASLAALSRRTVVAAIALAALITFLEMAGPAARDDGTAAADGTECTAMEEAP